MVQQAIPVDRYGAKAPGGRRRAMIFVFAVLVAAGLTWAAWVAYDDSQVGVTSADGLFTAVDSGHGQFGFSVTMDPGRRAVCTVRLFNEGLTEVGRLNVDVGPSRERTFTVNAVVPTFEAATTGTVEACALR